MCWLFAWQAKKGVRRGGAGGGGGDYPPPFFFFANKRVALAAVWRTGRIFDNLRRRNLYHGGVTFFFSSFSVVCLVFIARSGEGGCSRFSCGVFFFFCGLEGQSGGRTCLLHACCMLVTACCARRSTGCYSIITRPCLLACLLACLLNGSWLNQEENKVERDDDFSEEQAETIYERNRVFFIP